MWPPASTPSRKRTMRWQGSTTPRPRRGGRTPNRSPMSTEGEYVGPVERSIRDAIARGEFDNLSGTGKPLPDLDRQYDPDWWARRYVENMKAE
ncbi:MAG: DUF1992 domain-containing protein, partial [Actinomycetota bacterium]